MSEKEEETGFVVREEEPREDGAFRLWIHSDESGDPDRVTEFVLRCAKELDLQGTWGFCWAFYCSATRLEGFGGGPVLLDLGARKVRADVDLQSWVRMGTLAAEGKRALADDVLGNAAAREGWTPATQQALLLGFIDGLEAGNPGVVDHLRRHLDEVSEAEEEMVCRECGEPMWIAVEGTGHHWGKTLDNVDHDRDLDHTPIPSGDVA